MQRMYRIRYYGSWEHNNLVVQSVEDLPYIESPLWNQSQHNAWQCEAVDGRWAMARRHTATLVDGVLSNGCLAYTYLQGLYFDDQNLGKPLQHPDSPRSQDIQGQTNPPEYVLILKYCNLKSTSFQNANLKNAEFINCNLAYADFTGADLEGVKFIRCILFGVKGISPDQQRALNINVPPVPENMLVCDQCGDEVVGTPDLFNGLPLCLCCRDTITPRCESCGGRHPRNMVARMPDDRLICRNCQAQNYVTCHRCHNLVYNTAARGRGGYPYCDTCYQPEPVAIHDYSFRPPPIFFTAAGEVVGAKTLFFGVELETQHGDPNYNNLSHDALHVSNDKLTYCKRDGSVINGFEMVSMPFSWQWLKANPEKMKVKLDYLISKGYKSYDTNCCGMHVHLTRNAFDIKSLDGLIGRTVERENRATVGSPHLYRFQKFYYSHRNFIRFMSRRFARDLDSWAPLHEPGKDPGLPEGSIATLSKNAGIYNYNRHIAINLRARSTVEVRIFKGTLNWNSWLRNIEFCHATFEFTRNPYNWGHKNKNEYLTIDMFLEFVNNEKKEYPNLYKFLQDKLPKPEVREAALVGHIEGE